MFHKVIFKTLKPKLSLTHWLLSQRKPHQASMAVRPSAFGVLVVTVLKMFTRTRKRVTKRAMRPGSS